MKKNIQFITVLLAYLVLICYVPFYRNLELSVKSDLTFTGTFFLLLTQAVFYCAIILLTLLISQQKRGSAVCNICIVLSSVYLILLKFQLFLPFLPINYLSLDSGSCCLVGMAVLIAFLFSCIESKKDTKR